MNMPLINIHLFKSSLKASFKSIIEKNNISVTQIRYRKFNIKRPRTHFQRELVKDITTPKYVKPYHLYPLTEMCGKFIKQKFEELPRQYHPMEELMKDEVRQKIYDAKFVAIFHCHPYNREQLYDLRVKLNKIGLEYVYHTKTIINLALLGTSYESLLKLYEMKSFTFISQEEKPNFKKLLAIEKKSNIIVLIGGLYQGRMLTLSDINMLANKPNAMDHLMELSAILSMSKQNLLLNLTRHQTLLCQNLKEYVSKEIEEKNSTSN